MEPSLLSALLLSAAAGAAAIAVDLLPAILVARLLSRPTTRGRALLSSLVHLPIVLPPVVTGYLLLLLLGRNGPVGSLLAGIGVQIPFTFLACVVAAAVVSFPFLVGALRAALESLDPRLEGLALTLGDTPLRAFRRVTLPLAAPGLWASIVLGFARALGEFGATVVLAGSLEGETRTLSLAVYGILDRPGQEGRAALFCLVSVGLAVVSLVLYEWLLTRQKRRRAW
ncbi:MAG: molybdate ABC transporter permease subunit [Planctomycetaceae bacterium]